MSCDAPGPSPRNAAGHVALILGVLGTLFLFVPIVGDFITLPAAVGALVAGFIGIDRVGQGQATNRGDAVTGGILGGLVLMITLVMYAAADDAAQNSVVEPRDSISRNVDAEHGQLAHCGIACGPTNSPRSGAGTALSLSPTGTTPR